MRSTYRITADSTEEDSFDRALAVLCREATSICYRSVETGNVEYEIDYTVDLSKYELLYLRLTCKSNKVVNLSDKQSTQVSV